MRRVLLVFLLALPVLVAGIWLGGHPEFLPGPVRDGLADDETSRAMREALDEVADTYYRSVPERRLADEAIAGMVASLKDPFSAYLSPAEYRRFQQVQDSEFSGVGLTVSAHDDGLRVVKVFDGSPADRAGIRPGDIVMAVDGRSLAGRSQAAATAVIKGPPGTDVRLVVRRGKRERRLTVTRATISVPVVASELRRVSGHKIGVVALEQFSSGAHAEVYGALRKLLQRGADAFVLDLRDNGGGLVTEAQLVASAFLADGKIVTTRGRSVAAKTLEATGQPVVRDKPLVVLVDEDTASASEIVAGALQDRGRAELVGTRTFGKGVFQQVIELSNGGALDITAGQYYTPNGRNLGGKGTATGDGLAPDVRAEDDPDTPKDEALDRALAAVAGRA